MILAIIRFLFTAIVIIFFSKNIYSQEIIWNNISIGIKAEHTINTNDFHKYWGNFTSAGIIIDYFADYNFSFEGSLSFSYLKGKTDEKAIPDLVILNMPAGLKYKLIKLQDFNVNIIPGVTNSTFIFLGENAEKANENFIESEFGLFLSLSFQYSFPNQSTIEAFTSIQNIFSTPGINLYSFGLKFIW